MICMDTKDYSISIFIDDPSHELKELLFNEPIPADAAKKLSQID